MTRITRDYARVEGSGRVLGEKESSPPFTERLCYTHCPKTKAARSVNHERKEDLTMCLEDDL